MAAYAVVVDDEQRVLLCRRRGEDRWVLPGGSSRPGEPPWETVVRETEEETDLRVAVEHLVGVYVARDENDLVFAFRCRREHGSASPSDERPDVRWLAGEHFPHSLSDRDRERIHDAFDEDLPRLRAQAGGGEPPPPGVR